MNARILCVDDEPAILQAIRRQLHGKFQVDTAVGPEEGLVAMAQKGPYAVVVSDMRMPVMDGATFLYEVKQRSPDTVRIMLTGNAEQETAVAAVNKAGVFRFLSKPCAPDQLSQALRDGLAMHQALRAERELLETTLSGSIKVLTEILALVDPSSTTGAALRRETAMKLAQARHTAQTWEIEVASMLCRLGAVTLPPELAARLERGESRSPEDRELAARVPEISHRLLSQIPRLEGVAEIVLYQDPDADRGKQVPEGARILRCAAEYARLVSGGLAPGAAVAEMRGRPDALDGEIVHALSLLVVQEEARRTKRVIREVELSGLLPGHIVASPIVTLDGRLLLREGYPISSVMLERIRNLARLHGVRQPISIQEPDPLHK